MDEILVYIMSLLPVITAVLITLSMALLFIKRVKDLISDSEKQNRHYRKQMEQDKKERAALMRDNAELKKSLTRALNRIVNKVDDGSGK